MRDNQVIPSKIALLFYPEYDSSLPEPTSVAVSILTVSYGIRGKPLLSGIATAGTIEAPRRVVNSFAESMPDSANNIAEQSRKGVR